MLIAPVLEQPQSVATTWPESACISGLGDSMHIWQWAVPREDLHLESLLSADEVARSSRFHFSEHRHAFITNRARLRMVLAHYAGCLPTEVQFAYGMQGKPLLVSQEVEDLHFNLSHTNGQAALAMARGRRVGLDIERIVHANDFVELARSNFAPAEYRRLLATAPEQQLNAFYSCWTRKEAFLKGLGDGLNRNLAAFEVGFGNGVAPSLLACAWDPSLCQSWQIHHLELRPGYAGALAYEGTLPLSSHAITTYSWLD